MVAQKKRFDADIRLSDEAIDWVVKLSSGRATPEDHMQFELWRQRSEEHELAAMEAESLWHGLGPTGNNIRKTERNNRLTRRAVLGAAMMGVTGLAFERAGVIGPHLYADYVTGAAEQKTVHLDDGSTVVMNGNTALSVKMGTQERRLILFKGQALFEVAKEAGRPFIVEANDFQTRAIGTEFDVDMRPESVVVTVTEGVVQVSNPLYPERHVTAVANQRVIYGSSGSPMQPEDIDAQIETAWRRGKLIFNGRPLGDVVAALSRYQSGKIFIANSQLHTLAVTGVFDLNEPQSVLHTIEATLPVTVTRLPFITILR